MAKKNRYNYKIGVAARIFTNTQGLIKGNTVKEELYNLADSSLFSEDADQPGGFLGIDLTTGIVDVSFIRSASPSGLFLKDDGTWTDPLAGLDIGTVLSTGNVSGPIDLLFSDNFGIDTENAGETLNIGAANAGVINYGNSSTTHNFLGTAVYEYQVNAYVQDKLITLNHGGTASSAVSTGFEIEENNLITGYFKTNAARSGFSMKAPAGSYYVDLTTNLLTANRAFAFPDVAGTLVVLSQLTSGYVPYTGASATINAGTQGFVGGSLSLGTANPIGSSNIYIGSNATGVADFQSVFLETVAQSTTTTAIAGFTSRIGTQAASFTLPDLYHFIAGKGTFGAGSTVTRQYGFFAGNITGAGSNYSYYAQNAAASNVWNLYMAGTANNYLAGNVGIGVTVPTIKLQVLATTEQLRLNYDSSNYVSTTVGSTGAVTLDAVGSGASFNFSDQLIVTVNTGAIKLREMVSVGAGSNAIYMGTASPSNTNHILAFDTSNVYLNVPGSNSIYLSVGANNILRIGTTFLAPTDGINMILGTGTGFKLGTAASQKLGVLGATPVVQQTGGAAAAGAVYGSTEQTMIQKTYDCLRAFGFLS